MEIQQMQLNEKYGLPDQFLQYFPKQIAFIGKVIVKSKEDLFRILDNFNNTGRTINGMKTVYLSLYDACIKQANETCCINNIGGTHFCKAKLDKIHFDLDNDRARKTALRLLLYCLKNNYKCLVVCSGKDKPLRFHFYLFTKNYEQIKNTKATLWLAQHFIINDINSIIKGNIKAIPENKNYNYWCVNLQKQGLYNQEKITIGQGSTHDIDTQLIGDIARVVRLINTKHMESLLYCIPISFEDILQGEEFLLNKMQKQNFNFTFYGTDYFDISKFDNKDLVQERIKLITLTSEEHKEINTEEALKTVKALCVKKWLVQDPYTHYEDRYDIINYFSDTGWSYLEIDQILKKYLKGKKHETKRQQDNYDHMAFTEKQLQRLFFNGREKHRFSCRRIQARGECISGCPIFNKGIYL